MMMIIELIIIKLEEEIIELDSFCIYIIIIIKKWASSYFNNIYTTTNTNILLLKRSNLNPDQKIN